MNAVTESMNLVEDMGHAAPKSIWDITPHPMGVHVGNQEFLKGNDIVGVSFWIISIAMVVSATFFFLEGFRVKGHWSTSVNVGGLVCLTAGIHYWYMREFWLNAGQTPIVYRYIDWSITVPLQMIEFHLISTANGLKLSTGSFWRLLIGTVVMLFCGFLGEAGVWKALPGFIGGMGGWFFILFEIFNGETGTLMNGSGSDLAKAAFNNMRNIVTIGWAVYPLGYFFGLCMPSVDDTTLNLIYNIADFINKILFAMSIWHLAKCESTRDHADIEAGDGYVRQKE